ncbi:type II toxin-antitoxin system RelE/ParE family toxin [Alterisphingorhabdus coralli]|uniref:Type II toxin-antitoxin system RelE/ParE family toxin n=1 Tax=Alterisphingorhabdus coralli TaxID=3071408 RepID=A0AA97F798_9SPHN|nr:type II toxin-antitoxin system RelE/ParE family toxin [Parasphingorhabdus sp. SCSIO 66989]WOE74558.1 type II toxin-antitoxin system RelE/ParE family toxin [Parasphingorhabdus sp. SCSIO 66989]
MRRVVWSQAALADMRDQLHYIAAEDPEAAQRVVSALRETGNALAEFATGHPGRVAGTYEKSVRGLPYIIAYALSDDDRTLSILRVIHSARDWQPEDWPE